MTTAIAKKATKIFLPIECRIRESNMSLSPPGAH
jgi:hypothetical protein